MIIKSINSFMTFGRSRLKIHENEYNVRVSYKIETDRTILLISCFAICIRAKYHLGPTVRSTSRPEKNTETFENFDIHKKIER